MKQVFKQENLILFLIVKVWRKKSRAVHTQS